MIRSARLKMTLHSIIHPPRIRLHDCVIIEKLSHFCKEINLPIPELDTDGLLPVGIHDCTENEIYQRFGRFSSSDRRPQLFGKLQDYLNDARISGLFSAIIIDGSFITSKPEPGDIDLIAVLKSD